MRGSLRLCPSRSDQLLQPGGLAVGALVRARMLESIVVRFELPDLIPLYDERLRDLVDPQHRDLDALVAKRSDSKYEPGLRWRMAEDAINAGPDPVPWRTHTISPDLRCVCHRLSRGRQTHLRRSGRNFFTPTSRTSSQKLKPLGIAVSPFANLPVKKPGRWSAGFSAWRRWRSAVVASQ